MVWHAWEMENEKSVLIRYGTVPSLDKIVPAYIPFIFMCFIYAMVSAIIYYFF